MVKTAIISPEAVPNLPAFSHATISSSKTIFVSGSVGCDKSFKLVGDNVQSQARAALQNMSTILKSAGTDLAHVVKVNVYLADVSRDFVPMNEVYVEFFKESPPARTCVGVAGLPLGALVEIECIAELP